MRLEQGAVFQRVRTPPGDFRSGSGLLNVCEIDRKLTSATGIEFKIYGFDTGTGMPPPESFRDHPDW